jgi:hypothetical protein
MGNWASPSTKDAALRVAALLKEPLPAGRAEKTLYSLVGDDDLFDEIVETVREKGAEADVRYSVSKTVSGWIEQWKTNPSAWLKPWEPEAVTILEEAIARYNAEFEALVEEGIRRSEALRRG